MKQRFILSLFLHFKQNAPLLLALVDLHMSTSRNKLSNPNLHLETKRNSAVFCYTQVFGLLVYERISIVFPKHWTFFFFSFFFLIFRLLHKDPSLRLLEVQSCQLSKRQK